MAVLLSLAFLTLNAYDAFRLDLWYDEGWTLVEITGMLTPQGLALPSGIPLTGADFQADLHIPGPFSGVADTLYARDVHPPLYFQTLWVWAQMFGTSPLALRSLSILTLMAATWAIYRHQRARHESLALVSLAMLLASPGAAYAAVNARGYGLALLLITLITLALIRAMRAPRSPLWAFGAGIGASIAVMTHYFTILPLLPMGLVAIILWAKRRDAAAIGLAILGAIPGLVLAAHTWLPQHLDARPAQMAGFNSWPIEAYGALRIFVNQFTRFTFFDINITLLTLLGALTLLGLLVRAGWVGRSRPDVLLPFAGFAGGMVAIVALFWATDKTMHSFSVPRYGVFMLPCLVLLLPYALTWVGRAPWRIGLCTALVLALGLAPRMHDRTFDLPWADFQPTQAGKAAVLADIDRPRTIVVLLGEEPGMIGSEIPMLPARMPTIHIASPEAFAAFLAEQSYDVLHMRPMPWILKEGQTPFGPAYHAAAQAAGFSDQSTLRWARDTAQ